ncbi:MAG: hypothetical protein R2991_10840 [Thermoanaerobaculia bacterium]
MTGARLRHAALSASIAVAALAAPAAAQDFDGDSIPDAIENESWYIAAGGSPQRQDVWVECDYMREGIRKPGLVRQRAEGVFARAPVPGGIALHLTFDDVLPFERQWGDVSSPQGFQSSVDRLYTEYDRSFDARPFTGADAERMRPYVHYCVYVYSVGEGVSGFSPSIPADLFLVAVGQYRGEISSRLLLSGETGIFLHELGHNLGLRHGGARPLADSAYKPHYLSAMSYLYGWAFARLKGRRVEYFPYWDYSRSTVSPLHEKRLREERGVVVPEQVQFADTPRGDELLGLFYCEDGTFRAFYFNRALDFDCDGEIESGRVKTDISRDRHRTFLGRGHDDWNGLVFGTAGLGAGRRVSVLDPLEEPRGPLSDPRPPAGRRDDLP